MSLSHVVDGDTELDSALFNPWVDHMNGLQTGALPIALPGIEGALGDWAAADTTPRETVIYDQIYDRSDDPATNRVNLQTLLDRVKPAGSGGQVQLFIPPKWDGGVPDPLVVSRDGSNAWCIDVPSNTAISGGGVGSTLAMAGDQPNFTRLLNVTGKTQASIRRMRIDGNQANNDPSYEHNHCIFVYDSSDVLIEDVETVNATGDGVSISGSIAGSHRVYVNRIKSTGHKRNPVTVEQVQSCWITNSTLIVSADSGGQAIDSEPFVAGAWGGLYVIGNYLEHLDPSAAVIATSGYSNTDLREDVYVAFNQFAGGGMQVVRGKNQRFIGNTGTISQITMQAANQNILFEGNSFFADLDGEYAVVCQSNLSGVQDTIRWIENDLTLLGSGGGLHARGVDRFVARGGSIAGTSESGQYGIYVEAVRDHVDNAIRDIAFRNLDVAVRGRHGGYTLDGLTIDGLTIDTTTGAPIDLYAAASWISNLRIGAVDSRSTGSSPVLVHTGTPYVMDGMAGNRAHWNVYGTPEGVIVERVGATAIRRDGGTATTLYVKESGDGTNTGWVAK